MGEQRDQRAREELVVDFLPSMHSDFHKTLLIMAADIITAGIADKKIPGENR